MSDCCDFEPKIQADCLLEIAGIVKSGQLLARRAEVLQHGGCVAGCLGKYIEGGDEQVFGGELPESCPDTIEGCCEELEQRLSGEGAQAGPMVILLVRKLLKLLVNQLL